MEPLFNPELSVEIRYEEQRLASLKKAMEQSNAAQAQQVSDCRERLQGLRNARQIQLRRSLVTRLRAVGEGQLADDLSFSAGTESEKWIEGEAFRTLKRHEQGEN
jgi:hypothetical protein